MRACWIEQGRCTAAVHHGMCLQPQTRLSLNIAAPERPHIPPERKRTAPRFQDRTTKMVRKIVETRKNHLYRLYYNFQFQKQFLGG